MKKLTTALVSVSMLTICGWLLVVDSDAVSEETAPPQEGIAGPFPHPKKAVPTEKELASFVESNNDFAFKFYAAAKGGGKNLIFSPYSISAAVSMAYAGAKGQTQSEMASAMRFKLPEPTLAAAFDTLNQKLATRSKDSDDDLGLLLANSMWAEQRLQIEAPFLDIMNNYYKASFRRVEFSVQPETSRREINSWIKEHTQGKIVDMLASDDITPLTRMMLVSTIYLKAAWRTPFDVDNTHQSVFFPNPDETVSVSMMTHKDQYKFLRQSDYAVLELPYSLGREVSTQLSLLIALPNDHEGLAKVESSLTAATLKTWLAQLKQAMVEVTIPKFKLKEKNNLNQILASLGMVKAFLNQADFSGINGKTDLKVEKVIHEAFFNLDEAGTEAGAATAVSMALKSFAPVKDVEHFVADHPFIFLIVDRSSGTVLFMGRVMQP